MQAKPTFSIRPKEIPADQGRVTTFISEQWCAPAVVAHGAVYYPADLPGFIAVDAEDGENWLGLITYHVDGEACEIVTIDSIAPAQGIGTALLSAVRREAEAAGCTRLWLITTNDNLHALRFYQKRGFHLAALHKNAIAASRRLKPEIPLLGMNGIPIRDEIELAMILTPDF